MTLNGVAAVILRYFTVFSNFLMGNYVEVVEVVPTKYAFSVPLMVKYAEDCLPCVVLFVLEF